MLSLTDLPVKRLLINLVPQAISLAEGREGQEVQEALANQNLEKC
jgi:hypothetical protein